LDTAFFFRISASKTHFEYASDIYFLRHKLLVFVDSKGEAMNVYQWVGVFVVVAAFFLVIILPPSLIALEPDTGWPQAEHFYSSSGGKIKKRMCV
jgi:hypothetical protein